MRIPHQIGVLHEHEVAWHHQVGRQTKDPLRLRPAVEVIAVDDFVHVPILVTSPVGSEVVLGDAVELLGYRVAVDDDSRIASDGASAVST